MIDPTDSIFHVIYDFDSWIYSEWFQNWILLAQNKYNPNIKQLFFGVLVDLYTFHLRYKKVQSVSQLIICHG